jgi:hypothetical protein
VPGSLVIMLGMLSAYGACAILLAVASILGRAICGVCGVDRWTWTAPAVGFAALLTVVDAVIRLPGGGWTSLFVVLTLVVASIGFVARKGLGIDAGSLALAAGPVVVAVAVFASGSYLINNDFGIPGVSILNDFAGHLPWAEALREHDSPFKLIIPGYPIGCFALAGTVGRLPGISVLAAFQGILIVTPVILAVTTLALFERLGLFARVLASTVVSLAYLITAALAEGAFKEPIEALLIVAIALCLQDIARGTVRWHRAATVPIAVLIAGSVANYSYPGLTWPLLIIATWLALEAFRRRRTITRALAVRAIGAGLIGVAALALLSLPEIVRFHAFAQAQVATIDAQTGNVPTVLPWRETLGIWFSDDFRVWQTESLNLQHALLVFAVAVFVFGIVQAWRRGESSLLALLAAALVVALYTRHTANAYNGAKALMVLSCAAVLVSVRGVFPTGRVRFHGKRRTLTLESAGALAAALFGMACLWSDGLVLRGAQVGPLTHTHELQKLDRMLAGHTVLFLGEDDFAAWELRGTRLAYLAIYDIPSLPVTFRPGYPFVVGEPADFNTFSTQSLNDFDYVVATRTAYASVPPANWHPVAATRFYQVWARTGVTASDAVPSGAGSAPGQLVNCSTPAGKALSRIQGTALVTAPPVVLDGSDWQGAAFAHLPGASVVAAGMTVGQQVTLPPGRWQLSLQYTSATSLTVHTRGLKSELPAALEHQGPYWPVGDVTSTGSPLSVSIAVHAPPPLATSRSAFLGNIAFVRVDASPRRVPLRAACGEYVNWYVS